MARDLSIAIHKMTMDLPRFEQFEVGSQIRRSSKSIRSNIVEGYGRRYYKKEFVRFIIFALASNYETKDHLDTLFETGSLANAELYESLRARIDDLGAGLNSFLKAIIRNHTPPDFMKGLI